MVTITCNAGRFSQSVGMKMHRIVWPPKQSKWKGQARTLKLKATGATIQLVNMSVGSGTQVVP